MKYIEHYMLGFLVWWLIFTVAFFIKGEIREHKRQKHLKCLVNIKRYEEWHREWNQTHPANDPDSWPN